MLVPFMLPGGTFLPGKKKTPRLKSEPDFAALAPSGGFCALPLPWGGGASRPQPAWEHDTASSAGDGRGTGSSEQASGAQVSGSRLPLSSPGTYCADKWR